MKSLAGQIRLAAQVLAEMSVEADLISSVKSTWDAIRETDLVKKAEIFVQRAGESLRRWLSTKLPGVANAISKGTDGALVLTPGGELLSKDRRVRIML